MTNWLDEIEGRILNKYAQALDCGEGDLALDIAIADGEDMARVLRELARVIIKYRQAEGKALCKIFMADCSHFAKELLK